MSGTSRDPLEPTELWRSGDQEALGEENTRQAGSTETVAKLATEPAPAERLASPDLEPTEAVSKDSHEATTKFGGEAETTTAFSDSFASNILPGSEPRLLGDYELLEILGRGGMGAVYRARQISLNRQVALKLIRPDRLVGEVERRQFQYEAEAIAALDHPGIVPIYEIGVHDHRHYFSMKLIQGDNLQQASRELRGDFRAIGRIMAGAARAVQHAHERGILHRDLKPSNILLDADRKPHVSDFGLATRIEVGTEEFWLCDAIVGTPAYMAPEQTTANRRMITTTTDVYGLGSTLYALLSGHAPHRGSTNLEILDAVREVVPARPSKVDPTIPRDLEAICLKCLEKDPSNRYRSAGEVADDLDRWLDGRPIVARPVGAAARGWMWCKRKPLIAALAAALLVSTIVGATGILINWVEVRRQRDELALANLRIQSEWETSRQLNEFLVSDLLAWSSPFVAGRRDVPVSALLDRSARIAASRFLSQPKVNASIHQALGEAYLAVGKLDKAESELLYCFRLRQSLPEWDELDRLSSQFALARLRLEQGRYDEAERHAIRAREGRESRLGEADEATLEAAALLGALRKFRGKIDEAEALLQKTALLASDRLGRDHRVTLRILTDLAIIAHDRGRFQEAFDNFNELSRISTHLLGPNHPETLFARSRLGAALFSLGEEAKAEQILDSVLNPAREVLGPDHSETLRIGGNLAAVRARLGKHEEAARGFEETLKGQRSTLPADHPDRFSTETNLAVLLLILEKPAEAERILDDLIVRMRASPNQDDLALGSTTALLASALWDLDRTIDAETINDQALGLLGKTRPADHPQVVHAETVQAAILLANGKFADAEKLATKVIVDLAKPVAAPSPWLPGTARSVLGGALAARGKYKDAEPFLVDGYEWLQANPVASKRRIAQALERVIQLYESWDRLDDAARWRARRVARPVP